MSDLTVFDFESNSIRFVDGKPVAKDVAIALGYLDPRRAVNHHVSAQNKGRVKISTPGGNQSATVLYEAGIYQLIFSSKLPSAEKFQQWVFSEILPSIRKTGGYFDSFGSMTDEEKAVFLATALLKERDNRIALQAQIKSDEPATILGKAIASASDNIRIGDFARAIGVGQNTYFQELRDDSIIQLTSVLPYQRYLTAGYFVVTEVVKNKRIFMVAMITPKGQVYLAKRHQKYVLRDRTEDAMEKVISAIV
jgi:anti-repressor protein